MHSVAAALGLSALFLTLPTLYHVLRWASAAYLLYLEYKAFRSGDGPAVDADAAGLLAGSGRESAQPRGDPLQRLGLLSGRLAALLRRSRRVARGLDYFSGMVFAGPAVRLAAASK